jgi:hypothetical protein
VDAQRADRVADDVAKERVFVLGRLDHVTRRGIGGRQNQASRAATAPTRVAKKKLTAIMCAGL